MLVENDKIEFEHMQNKQPKSGLLPYNGNAIKSVQRWHVFRQKSIKTIY